MKYPINDRANPEIPSISAHLLNEPLSVMRYVVVSICIVYFDVSRTSSGTSSTEAC
jgi:hypothetical protein